MRVFRSIGAVSIASLGAAAALLIGSLGQPAWSPEHVGASKAEHAGVRSPGAGSESTPHPQAPVCGGCSDISRTIPDVDGHASDGAAPLPRGADDSVLLRESLAELPVVRRWADGVRYGAWRSLYDGYGTTSVRAGEPSVLSQSPKPASSDDETHGAMVVTVQEFGDIDLTVRQRTVKQLRTPDPQPWEVPWTIWAHADDEHFYYLVLKPNGWELGKEDPDYPGSQRYLVTGSTPTFPVGPWHTVRVRQTGNTIEAWGDGYLLTRFTDHERPYRGGHVGLYTEDAHVEHADPIVSRP